MIADQSGSEAPEVIRLFPTFVWSNRLRPAAYEPIHAAVLGVLRDLRRELPPLPRGEAWQSAHGLHRVAELAALMSNIQRAVESVLAFLRIGPGALEVTGCWANVNAPGAPHRMHTHPNNFLSGVYYVHVTDGADTITFMTRGRRPPSSGPRSRSSPHTIPTRWCCKSRRGA